MLYVLNKISRLVRKKISGNSNVNFNTNVLSGKAVNDLIIEKLQDDRPCMIARFGSVELNCVVDYSNSMSKNKYWQYILGNTISYKITSKTYNDTFNNAGIFPAEKDGLEKFSKLMLDDMAELDILGSWLMEETIFQHKFINAKKVKLSDLEPYYHNDPWTKYLKGKKVLVIHPFEKSIKSQYLKREKLYKNNILPEFELLTIKAVQSIAGQSTGFNDWFDALEYMKNKINEVEFDLAIIGCGAYGFPLAAYIKRLGKKAIHLGGATQILFGIKGARWVGHPVISKFINEFWVSPDLDEKPGNFKNVENGCYW